MSNKPQPQPRAVRPYEKMKTNQVAQLIRLIAADETDWTARKFTIEAKRAEYAEKIGFPALTPKRLRQALLDSGITAYKGGHSPQSVARARYPMLLQRIEALETAVASLSGRLETLEAALK